MQLEALMEYQLLELSPKVHAIATLPCWYLHLWRKELLVLARMWQTMLWIRTKLPDRISGLTLTTSWTRIMLKLQVSKRTDLKRTSMPLPLLNSITIRLCLTGKILSHVENWRLVTNKVQAISLRTLLATESFQCLGRDLLPSFKLNNSKEVLSSAFHLETLRTSIRFLSNSTLVLNLTLTTVPSLVFHPPQITPLCFLTEAHLLVDNEHNFPLFIIKIYL